MRLLHFVQTIAKVARPAFEVIVCSLPPNFISHDKYANIKKAKIVS